MVQLQNKFSVQVIWKGKKFSMELNLHASLKELGDELQVLTDVKPDTMRLIIPQSTTKSSKMFTPFSDEHSCITLQDIGIAEGKPLRMLGVYEHEVDQLLKDAKVNLRIAGFEDEEKRMELISGIPHASLKLPQGPYIFCDFRTLELPGLQLNPPPSEALKRMHMLASDPGIVAIMNKHRWRVGIMTEMAPVGYVGISPKCLLGFNKNRGEEISLRLRTDDLKGFRKYESIKKTLLHELAHMVFTEHDSNFYGLDKQLNQEASALDWTRSRSRALTDNRFSGHDDFHIDFESESSLPQKLGGATSHMAMAAREASVAAAHHRLVDSSTDSEGSAACKESSASEREEVIVEYDDWYRRYICDQESGSDDSRTSEQESGSDDSRTSEQESGSDDSRTRETMDSEPYGEANEGVTQVKVNLGTDDSETRGVVPKLTFSGGSDFQKTQEEPDPDDSEISESKMAVGPHAFDSQAMQIDNNTKSMFKTAEEPDPDDFEAGRGDQPQVTKVHVEPDPNDARENRMQRAEPDPDDFEASRGDQPQVTKVHVEPDPDDARENRIQRAEPDPDDRSEPLPQIPGTMTDEPDPDDEELRRIQDPVNVFCDQLTKATQKLLSDLRPSESKVVLETLFKIISNVSQNPTEMKYKKLRKANPVFQRNIVSHKAAMEVLFLIGFREDTVTDETGKSETHLVLKRNDPGLLWLAKSTLDSYIS